MHYRRDRTAGATYFFTVITWQRTPWFADPGNIARLRQAFREAMAAYPFHIDAIVILPEHLHCLWTLPSGDDNYPLRWNRIKGAFTRALPESARHPRASGHRREQAVWQRRYWEHRIRNDEDFARHCDYIHWNPVKHGLVEHAADWPHSSFDRFVSAGVYSRDWGMAAGSDREFAAGE